MQNRSLGILVFPTDRSDLIPGNPSLLHYGSCKSNSSATKKPYYSKEESDGSGNSSNPIRGDKLSFRHHPSDTISTKKFNQSNQQCSKIVRANNDDKEESNLMMNNRRNSLILQIGNETKKSSENKMTNVENEFDQRKLSNFSKFPKIINDTSTSYSGTHTFKLLSTQTEQEIIESIAQQPSLSDAEQYKSNF